MVCQVLSNGWFNRNWWYLMSVTNIDPLSSLSLVEHALLSTDIANLAKNHFGKETWVMMISCPPDIPFLSPSPNTNLVFLLLSKILFSFKRRSSGWGGLKKAASRGLLKGPLQAKRGNCLLDDKGRRRRRGNSSSNSSRGYFNKQITHLDKLHASQSCSSPSAEYGYHFAQFSHLMHSNGISKSVVWCFMLMAWDDAFWGNDLSHSFSSLMAH